MIGQGITALDPTIGLLQKELEVNNVQPGQEAAYFQSKGRPLSPQLVFLIQANQQLQKESQMAQARPPQGTVADDLSAALVQKANAQTAPMMPARQQGVAQLPNANVGSQRAYAGGGIVAFAEGGLTQQEKDELAALRKIQAPSIIASPYGGAAYLNTEAQEAVLKATNPRFKALSEKEQKYNEAVLAEKRAAAAAEYAKQAGVTLPPQTPVQTPPAAPAAPAPAAPAIRRPAVAANPFADPTAQATEGDISNYFSALGGKPAAKSDYEIVGEKRKAELDKPESERLAKIADKWKKSGVDKFEADRLARLESREKQADLDKKQDLWMQLAAAGFGSVGKGRTFAQGIGQLGSQFAQGAMSVNKEYKALKNTLEDAKDKLAEAKAYRLAGDYDSAHKAEQDAVNKYEQFVMDKTKLDQTAQQHRDTVAQADRALASHERISKAQIAASREPHALTNMLNSEIMAQAGTMQGPARVEFLVNKLREMNASAYGADIRSNDVLYTQAANLLKNNPKAMLMSPEQQAAELTKLVSALAAGRGGARARSPQDEALLNQYAPLAK